MISFLLCLAILIVGYFVYGKIVDNTFGPDDRETPAVRINDGVDYVVMPQWKLFLVQLLNIAGLGPIFGAMQGALWGPVVFLWITFGTIFAGGVHDYFSGMMSERNDGASIAEITGKYLGPVMQNVMRVFSVVLLIMVGTVFAVGPAGLIVELCSQSGASGVLTSLLFWLIIILVYYFIATFISIDDGHDVVVCTDGEFRGHSDTVLPFRAPDGNMYIYTCREDKDFVGCWRVVTYDAQGNVVWRAVQSEVTGYNTNHMHIGWVMTTKPDYRKIALAVKIEPIAMHIPSETYLFDALTGEPVEYDFPIPLHKCVPVDFMNSLPKACCMTQMARCCAARAEPK